VLVTGGTGSFGNKLVEVMLREHRPRRLVVFSRDELKQSEMGPRHTDPDGSLRFFVGDVRDRERLERAMHGVDVVFHAAAMKQIPACEYNPFEAIQTNVLGTKNVIDAAIDQGVKRVIGLSTDKAVNPINLYGATKLCGEKLLIQGNVYGHPRGTVISVVRYGNVIGSRGSVIPLFAAQRAAGRVTVTDRAMTRFWITLEQGVAFAVRCAELMRGGEIFVPKIPSMRIMDLVAAVAPGCAVDDVGIRPGEKLHESLISDDESRQVLELDDMSRREPHCRRGTSSPGRPACGRAPASVLERRQPDRFSPAQMQEMAVMMRFAIHGGPSRSRRLAPYARHGSREEDAGCGRRVCRTGSPPPRVSPRARRELVGARNGGVSQRRRCTPRRSRRGRAGDEDRARRDLAASANSKAGPPRPSSPTCAGHAERRSR
jgi:UDP-N-acetylglucosamine 4,6-dehydratase (inverting)